MNDDKKRSQGGYNLIQMAMALLVMGLIASPFITLYNVYETQNRINTTTTNIDSVKSALQSYKQMFGIYPCPAPMKVLRSSSAYGNPVSCSAAPFTTMVPGTCGTSSTDSVCIERSIASRGLAAPLNRVIVGSIPFRLLQVDENRTVDGYGSKIVYAVTQSQTNPTTFDEANAAIAIYDQSGVPQSTPDGAASFIVISPGSNKAGAYDLQGSQQAPCAGVGLDLDNCHPGFETGNNPVPEATYRAMYENDAVGANYYDDTVDYFVNIMDPLWRRTLGNFQNIQDISGLSVGVGAPASSAGGVVELDVYSAAGASDSIRVNGTNGLDGKILVDQVCDRDNPGLCFTPQTIGGDAATALNGTNCNPATEYLAGIRNGRADCRPLSTLSVGCDPTSSTPVLMGINGVTGQPICSALPNPGCPSQSVSGCSGLDVLLPTTPSGNTTDWIVATGSSCRSVKYKCNGGTWAPVTAQGRCTFTAGAIVSSSCGNSCGFGYTGTYCNNVIQPPTCLLANVNVNTRAIDCVCTGGTQTNTRNCSSDPAFGSGFTGVETRTETKTAPTCASVYGAWDTSACRCAAGTPGTLRWVQDGTCPPNYIPQPPYFANYGGPEKEQVLSAACTWSDTGNKRGTCTCNTAARITRSDHVCGDAVCEQSSVQDVFTATVNPTTCASNPPIMTTPGSCTAKSFKWVLQSPSGPPSASYPPDKVFDQKPCTCGQNGTTNSHCYVEGDSSLQPYKCLCQ